MYCRSYSVWVPCVRNADYLVGLPRTLLHMSIADNIYDTLLGTARASAEIPTLPANLWLTLVVIKRWQILDTWRTEVRDYFPTATRITCSTRESEYSDEGNSYMTVLDVQVFDANGDELTDEITLDAYNEFRSVYSELDVPDDYSMRETIDFSDHRIAPGMTKDELLKNVEKLLEAVRDIPEQCFDNLQTHTGTS